MIGLECGQTKVCDKVQYFPCPATYNQMTSLVSVGPEMLLDMPTS